MSHILDMEPLETTQDNAYTVACERASHPDTREDFWREQAQKVHWFRQPQHILDSSKAPFYQWFPDGLINICYNTIDRHLGKHNKLADPAVIWISNMVNKNRTYTWKELYENTCKAAKLLQDQGVVRGDRVIIFVPMIPEGIFFAMACARLGAIHSIVFGGFAAKELANRMSDCTPKAVVLATFGL